MEFPFLFLRIMIPKLPTWPKLPLSLTKLTKSKYRLWNDSNCQKLFNILYVMPSSPGEESGSTVVKTVSISSASIGFVNSNRSSLDKVNSSM